MEHERIGAQLSGGMGHRVRLTCSVCTCLRKVALLLGVAGGDVLLIVLLASIDEVAIAANVWERQF